VGIGGGVVQAIRCKAESSEYQLSGLGFKPIISVFGREFWSCDPDFPIRFQYFVSACDTL
jgi:hypothetical protein